MAFYLATVGADALGNWQVCKREGVWGVRERGSHGRTGTANAMRVRRGDIMFVWLSKDPRNRKAPSGIKAKATVTGDFKTVGAGATIPWPDRSAYVGSFPIEVTQELAVPVGDRFQHKRGVASGIENIALIHGFREVSDKAVVEWIERAFCA